MVDDVKKGYFYGISAFFFWGFVPIYFKSVAHISAFEVLAHRIVWSVLFLLILLVSLGQFKEFIKILFDKKKLFMLFISATLISANWLIFIWAVANEKILETSFGYFINPIVTIALGYLFFQERLNRLQSISVALAILGVIYQGISIGLIPLVSLGLAFSFGLYGFVRKIIGVSSMSGLMVETMLILPFALFYLYTLDLNGAGHFLISLNLDVMLLIFAGFITVIPLIWFNIAASKLPYSTIGFLQYIGPTIAFLIAIFLYNEPFSTHKFISFAIIWVALIIYSYDYFSSSKKSKN